MTGDADKLLSEWEQHADAVESQIKCRDHRKFRLAYRKAEQCSRQIQFLMRHGHIKGFMERKEKVKELVERWNRISEELIKPWKDDVKSKLDKSKLKRKATNKINKAYSNAMKPAGRSLRMKAR